MYSYFALWKKRIGDGPPVGIFVKDPETGDALLWNHRQKAWQYNPDLVARFLFDDRNWDRYESVDRETAERVTLGITGWEVLPDEETIAWIFSWKGAPPQSED